MRKSEMLTITSSAQWIEYFLDNARRQHEIRWELGLGAATEELAAIVPSLRGWQLGETSDGRHLLAAARNYAAQVGDPGFVDAVRLFIAEEQRHGECLGQFLDLAQVARATSDWGDSLFRATRYFLPSMEVWVTPVVMVETHAMVYYNAIRRATKSVLLRLLCEQILRDEVAHIRFQCERLAILHRRRAKWMLALVMAGHRILFAAITMAIWFGHRRAIRAGGYSFPRFWRSTWAKMRFAWQIMSPHAYSWADDAHRSSTATIHCPARATNTAGNGSRIASSS
jgi:hypothetical protein